MEVVITSAVVVAKIDYLSATLRLWMEVYRRVRDHVARVTDPGLLKEINRQLEWDFDDFDIGGGEPYVPYDIENLERQFGSAAADLLIYVDNSIRQGEPLTMALVEQAIRSVF